MKTSNDIKILNAFLILKFFEWADEYLNEFILVVIFKRII